VDAYTAVFELATAAEAEHAGQHLDHLAAYHPHRQQSSSPQRLLAQLTLAPAYAYLHAGHVPLTARLPANRGDPPSLRPNVHPLCTGSRTPSPAARLP
jgi:hypothetical protein